jgi:hypothetical protein
MSFVDVDDLIRELEAALVATDEAAALAHLAAARDRLTASGLTLVEALGRPPATSAAAAASAVALERGPGFGFDPVTEDRLLIERILALPGLSDDLAQELEGYRRDIEAGSLSGADRRYLIALRQRLARSGGRAG